MVTPVITTKLVQHFHLLNMGKIENNMKQMENNMKQIENNMKSELFKIQPPFKLSKYSLLF